MWLILDGCPPVPLERYTTPCCYQWLLALSLDNDLSPFVGGAIDFEVGLVLHTHLVNGLLVLMR
jgi:hypothetical protein